jgi:hypothetical protein
MLLQWAAWDGVRAFEAKNHDYLQVSLCSVLNTFLVHEIQINSKVLTSLARFQMSLCVLNIESIDCNVVNRDAEVPVLDYAQRVSTCIQQIHSHGKNMVSSWKRSSCTLNLPMYVSMRDKLLPSLRSKLHQQCLIFV